MPNDGNADALTGKRATAFRAAQVVRAKTITTRKIISELCGMDSAGEERVNDLRDAHIVQLGPRKFGRSSAVRLSEELGFLIGVDIGHDHLAVTAADTALNPLLGRPVVARREDIGTNASSALDDVADAITDVVQKTGRPLGDLVGVGMGIPGPVDLRDGTISSATHVLAGWWQCQPAEELKQRLRDRLDATTDVAIANDATLGALGVFTQGVLSTPKLEDADEDLIYVRIGGGVGAGIVAGGRPVYGGSGFAGELGHLKVDDHGPLCPRCGQRGCVETKASARFITAQVSGERRGIIEFRPRTTNAERLEQMVESRHPACGRALGDAGHYVGTALAHACTLLDPRRVYVTGTVAKSRHFMKALADALHANATTTVGREAPDADELAPGFVVAVDPQVFHQTGLGEPELFGAAVLPLHTFGDQYIRERIIRDITSGDPEYVARARQRGRAK